MTKNHPPIAELELFFRSASPSSSVPYPIHVVRHLLAGCSTCCDLLRAAGWTGPRLERFVRLSATKIDDSGHGYESSFAGAERKLVAFFAPESPLKESPEKLLAEIFHLSHEGQAQGVSSDSRFQHPEVVRYLIDRSHAVRYEDPQKMLHLAQLARLAAEGCPISAAGSAERLSDIRLQAWGHLGNSLRVCGQLPDAEEALAKAQLYRREGTGDPPLHARMLEQWAS